ncbi:hypothetical protein ACQ4PT_059564 [Festuca glaucescens]
MIVLPAARPIDVCAHQGSDEQKHRNSLLLVQNADPSVVHGKAAQCGAVPAQTAIETNRQPYMEYTPLKDLSRNSYRWKVMVRVARIWEFRSSDQSTMFSLEFIAVDQQADLFDADGLMEASAQEPVIILFVGMTVGQYSGLLAFKSTSVTRWYVNVPILEIAAVHERSKHLPYRIQLHDGSQGRTEPIVSSIAEISTFEPNDIMGECYKISVKITEVLSEDGWYYMSCTACWKKLTLEDGVYMCPNCSTVVPLARHRFVARAIDTDIADIQSVKSADLYFFGPRGDAIVGKDASALVSSTRGQSSSVPPELLAIVGKEYNVVVTPRRESLDALYSHLQVQIVDPIIRASTALRQATADRTADKNDENYTVPQALEQIETAGQASTPPPSTDLTPSKVASSGSAVDKVPSSSSGRGKRKNSGSTTSPKSKKTLQFPGND